jgi:hypothetical protein
MIMHYQNIEDFTEKQIYQEVAVTPYGRQSMQFLHMHTHTMSRNEVGKLWRLVSQVILEIRMCPFHCCKFMDIQSWTIT